VATATVKTGSKSDAIRAILKKQPGATLQAVQEALKKEGVKASNALVNKIKYGRNGTKRSTRREGTSKAEAIRQTWGELGTHARPRDVIAHLAERGVKVSSAQVSILRQKSAGAAPAASSVSLEHLLAAKGLVEQLGSLQTARAALSSLARIMRP